MSAVSPSHVCVCVMIRLKISGVFFFASDVTCFDDSLDFGTK